MGEDEEIDTSKCRMIALDKTTLAQRASFPLPWPGVPLTFSAHGGQLFIPCTQTHTIHVPSTSGEELRAITGAFRQPTAISIFDERIYLLASQAIPEGDEETDDGDDTLELVLHVLT